MRNVPRLCELVLRLAFVIQITLQLISKATWWVLATCWRVVVTTVLRILCMPLGSVYGERNCPSMSGNPLTILSACMRQQKARLMAHTCHLYGLPSTGLRFFTVYGPWGRPDMAPMLFARAILAGEPIKVFNHGKMQRDFTYIDDIVEGVFRCCDKPASPNPEFDPLDPDPATAAAPHRVFNIGNSQPVDLMKFIRAMEEAFGRESIKDFQPMQPGDVVATAANTSALEEWVGFRPTTSIEFGIQYVV